MERFYRTGADRMLTRVLNVGRTRQVAHQDPESVAGELFFEPGGAPHSILVLEDVRLDVVRLLPPGAEATTEVR
jgi:hypothetical protein